MISYLESYLGVFDITVVAGSMAFHLNHYKIDKVGPDLKRFRLLSRSQEAFDQ